MKRHYDNFIQAYLEEYAKDAYESPPQFNLWTGLSILSGALERNVWVEEGTLRHYPSTLILLVSNPGVGKSVAIRKGSRVIERLREKHNPEFKTLTGTATQAGFLKALSIYNIDKQKPQGQDDQYSSLFYYAGEGSDSGLTNVFGDFNATLTHLYDCEDKYEKSLRGEYIYIPKPSVCLLSGCTFEFLKTLVNQRSVMNGLASRIIYATSDDDGTRKGEPMLGIRDNHKESDVIDNLAHDLFIINSLRGPFKVERAALDLYKDWINDHNKRHRALTSERMQSLMVRKPVTLVKVMELLSVSERNDLGIMRKHVDKAIKMVEEVTANASSILSSATISNRQDQSAVTQFILQTIKKSGGTIASNVLKAKFLHWGGEISRYEGTVRMLKDAEMIELSYETPIKLKLLVDPDRNL